MNRTTRISARAMLAVASLAVSPAAWSLGLGDASVESYLNQPLRAKIDLITREGEDLSSVSARLASAEDYELIGASLEDLAVPVRFSIEDIDGDAYLMASSQLPVSSPVIRLIVEVNWSSGRMLREYTLFLDPPVAGDQSAPLPRVDQRQAAPAPAPRPAATPEPAEPAVAEAAPEPQAPAEPRAPTMAVSGGAEYGPVASGETLWGIAKDWSGRSGLDINKVMIAIQRENPEAFLNSNINLLKRGAILRMPEVGEVERITRQAAYNEVAAQEEAFYARQAGITSPATPLLSGDRAYEEPEPAPLYGEQEVEAGRGDEEPAAPEQELAAEAEFPEPAVEADLAAEEPAPDEPSLIDQLELVPPSEASELDSTYGFEESDAEGEAAAATQALRESLARTEEELISQQQQNEYLAERIRELESQLEDEQQDGVADADLAAMEQRLRAEREAEQAKALEQPWYARFGVWLLGLLVVVAAAVAWAIGRRSGRGSGGGAIEDLKGEAEEVLRVLEEPKPEPEPAAGQVTVETEQTVELQVEEPAPGDEAESGQETPRAESAKPKKAFGGGDDEASFLDTESSDPEIQLDLARAYISMGDKEAARVILEEVAASGSEEQQAEARKMLDLM